MNQILLVDPFVGRKVLGRYRIVRPLGRGGMGLIYLARVEGAANFVKPAVVKRAAPDLLAKEPSFLQVMGREARIMSHLNHPSIVRVLDFAEEDGGYLLVLEYVHGFHLGQWSRFLRHERRPFPVDLGIHIVCMMLDALHYAHTMRGADGEALGIVHRDVSPGNVLLDVDGTVKLADFGIARMHSDQTETTDQPSLVKGKFAYMAPELLSHTAPSPSTDVYAAAVVLHELLVGKNELRVPDSVEATIARIVQHVPSRPGAVRKDVPAGLDDILARALAKDPGGRYADAASLAVALRAFQPTSDTELDRRLAAVVGDDFRNPQMPTSLNLTDLATLDRAWREPPPEATEVDVVVDVPVRRSENPTVLDPQVRQQARAAVPRVAVGAIALGLLATGGGAYALLSSRDAKPAAPMPAPVIVVNGQISGGDGLVLDAAGAPSVASGAPPANAIKDTGAVDRPPLATGSSSPSAAASSGGGIDGLTRAFARRQPQVARCFTANAAEVTGTPEIAVRFTVNVAGHVTAAQVLPPAIAGTPLGACLTSVARGTEFGPQPREVSFRIPIVARRSE